MTNLTHRISILTLLALIMMIPNSSFAQMSNPTIEFGNTRITNAEGIPVSTVNTGDRIFFSIDVKNNLDEKVDFVYVLTLDNLQSASWIAGSLEPGQQFSPAIGYTAKYGGTYNVGFYLVKSLPQILNPDDPEDYNIFAIEKNQLSAPIFLKINVNHQLPPQEFTITDEDVKDNLEFVTTSEISNVLFNKENKRISFIVSGPSGTFGSLILKIPVFLLDDLYQVTRGGQPYYDWSIERVGVFNYVTINYSHSNHDFALHFNQRNEPLSTSSGHMIRYDWAPFPISDNTVAPHRLSVSVSESDNPNEPKSSKVNIKIAKSGSVRYDGEILAGDDGTGNSRIGNNVLYKDPNRDSEKLDMEITLLEYDNTLIGERADPIQEIIIIPEYPLGVLIILFTAITFVILSTRFRTLKHIHF